MDKSENCGENAKSYIDSISSVLERHFDITLGATIEHENFDLYACYRANYHKSFLTRSTVYEGFSVFEHILLRVYNKLSYGDFEDFKQMLINLTPIVSNANKTHKQSIITGVILCEDEVDSSFEKIVKKFFYRKSYKLCFHGWSETVIAIYSLKTKKAYLPKTNKNLKKLFVDI